METNGRITNVKRNISFGIIQVIITQFTPFIVRTILINKFGADYLGINSLFTSVLSVLSLMEAGFGTAVVYSMYKPAAENDINQLCAYLSYFRRVYRTIGFSILFVGLALIPFLKPIVKDPLMLGGLNLYACYLIFLIDSVLSYVFFGYLTVIPTVFQRRDILSRIDIVIVLLKCSFQIIALLASQSFYLYLVMIPFSTVLRNAIIRVMVNKKYPNLSCKGSLTQNQKNELKKKVHGIFINKLTGVSRNSIDSLCISAFIGLTMVGLFNNYFFVIAGIIAFSSMASSSMVASVGNSIALENQEKNYKDMRMFDFAYMGISSWATVCMLCLFQPFIAVWIGTDMQLDISVVVGLCAYFYILKSGDIQWIYHEGAGLWYECRFIMIGEALTNIVLNIVLCKVMGVFGIVLATILSVFMTNCILCPNVLFKKYFKNGKLAEYWKDHALYTISMILTAGASWLACEFILPMNMVEENGLGIGAVCLLGRLVICTTISMCVFWLIWHRSVRFTDAVWLMKRIAKPTSYNSL